MELRDEYPRLRGLGAELLAVSTDDRSDARNVVLQLGVEFPVLYDPDTKVARQYGVYNLLGDSTGRPGDVRYRQRGEGQVELYRTGCRRPAFRPPDSVPVEETGVGPGSPINRVTVRRDRPGLFATAPPL